MVSSALLVRQLRPICHAEITNSGTWKYAKIASQPRPTPGLIDCGWNMRAFGPYLHEVADVLSVGENLAEALGAEYGTERGLGEEARSVVSVGHVHDGDDWIKHVVVDDRVHRHCHRVLRQDLYSSISSAPPSKSVINQ